VEHVAEEGAVVQELPAVQEPQVVEVQESQVEIMEAGPMEHEPQVEVQTQVSGRQQLLGPLPPCITPGRA
jgi:hypothetical protein